jgi:aminomethyltransferase
MRNPHVNDGGFEPMPPAAETDGTAVASSAVASPAQDGMQPLTSAGNTYAAAPAGALVPTGPAIVSAPPPHYIQPLLKTPFHNRARALSQRDSFIAWSGYTTVDVFTNVEHEYFAIRNATTLYDLTPMVKYRVAGPLAQAYLNHLVTRDISKLKVGRVAYCVWCNDAGHLIDDGTVFRLGEDEYRLCTAERQLDWLLSSAIGFDRLIIEEVTEQIAALAMQGPTSYAVLAAAGLVGVERLKPFEIGTFEVGSLEASSFEGGMFEAEAVKSNAVKSSTVKSSAVKSTAVEPNGVSLMVSRTGFTGDLGYELWMDPAHAERVWDLLMAAGHTRGIRPIGSQALNIARIEAGFLQPNVDFVSSAHTVLIGRDRSPLQLGLEWLVDFDKPYFTGRRALVEEKRRGSTRRLVGLDVEGNKPAHSALLYSDRAGRKEIGSVTSATWSPTCKRNIALAMIDAPHFAMGGTVWADIYLNRELVWERRMVRARIVERPFFAPDRRKATPPGNY